MTTITLDSLDKDALERLELFLLRELAKDVSDLYEGYNHFDISHTECCEDYVRLKKNVLGLLNMIELLQKRQT